MSAFFLFCFLAFPDTVSESTRRALLICADKLIPSLFPFVVIVGIINLSGAYEPVSRVIGRPIGKLLGINPCAVYAVLLGAVGGFPIGAVCVRDLYESGKIEKNEAERLLALSSNASPAFCIATIGQALLENKWVGVRLYICQLSAMIIVGLFLRRGSHSLSVTSVNPAPPSAAAVVASSVERGGITMLKICSFAVFFAVAGDIVCSFVKNAFGNSAACIIAAVAELTLGVRYATTLNTAAGAILTAFAVGWSGISVYMQIASVISNTGLSLAVYRHAKAAQGILTAILMCFTLS